MNREYHRWHSPSLGRDMELLVFGHAGARVLVFPTSMGRFYEWEDRGMIEALGEHLENGWIQAFCVDSVDAESWYSKHHHPTDRAMRQEQYERYLLSELIPYTTHQNPNPFLIAAGASFGAYHAVNLALRQPWHVDRAIGLSGLYDIKQMTGGYDDEHVYLHDPSHFLIHEHEPHRLEQLRRLEVILAIGRDDPDRQDNEHLAGVLAAKGIPHVLRVWDGWTHDWRWWREMIVKYIGGRD